MVGSQKGVTNHVSKFFGKGSFEPFITSSGSSAPAELEVALGQLADLFLQLEQIPVVAPDEAEGP